MNIDHIEEPLLEFGEDGKHVDLRFGILQHGPFDREQLPRDIRAALVGPRERVDSFSAWLDSCQGEIPGKAKTRLKNLFPGFPGFGQDSPFRARLSVDGRLRRSWTTRRAEKMPKSAEALLEYFDDEFSYLGEERNLDVVICTLPHEVLDFDDASDFRERLKVAAMRRVNAPVQLVLPSTYESGSFSKQRKRGRTSKKTTVKLSRQDDATIAWNFFTALYYKAGGTPWRMIRHRSDYETCFVGVAFYKALDESIQTSVAQIFNERGDGLIVRGGQAIIKKDRSPHLSREDAKKLLADALKRYRREHRQSPARIVLHKSSYYSKDEIEGFEEAAEEQSIELLDFLSLRSERGLRLFREGIYPPLRGTFMSLDEERHLLYTRGSVDFFQTYPGMYIPVPLLMRKEHGDGNAQLLAKEVLALTKMDWNRTQFDGALPITIGAARRVGKLLRHMPEGEPLQARYAFYM